MTRKQIAAHETAAAEEQLAPKRAATRKQIEATISTLHANALRFDLAGKELAAARCYELADRSLARLAAMDEEGAA
jgi:hypothetical protein